MPRECSHLPTRREDRLPLGVAVCLVLIASVTLASFLAADQNPKLRARVDAYLEPLVESRLFSGSVLLARDGEVLVQAGYGKAHYAGDVANTPQTRFKLMSVSKPLTAIAMMTLLQDGKLKLEDPVIRHLAGWPEAWKGVTLHHLLSHTSGVPNLEQEWVKLESQAHIRGLELWPRLAARLGDRQLTSRPGAQPSYSNFNFVLLGFVVEAVSGQSYTDYLRSAVLDPTGMNHTGLDDGSRFPELAMGYFRGRGGTLEESRQDMSMIAAAGGLYSTVVDLYRLDRALHRDELLDAPTRQLMWTPVKHNFASGWQVSRQLGRYTLHHSGGANGFVADYLRFPEDDACVVVLSNFAFAPVGRISQDLAAILFAEPYDRPRIVPPEELEAYAGTYRAPNRPELEVRRSGNALLLFEIPEGADRAGGELLVAIADGTFATPWSGGRLRFLADEQGDIARLSWRRWGTVREMERVIVSREPWRQALGTYRIEPPADAVEIVEEGGRLLMRGAGIWQELEIIPMSQTRAIGAFSETGGTLLELRYDDRQRILGFEWHRPDGVIVRGFRKSEE